MANLGMIELSFVLLGVMILLLGSGVWIAVSLGLVGFVAMALTTSLPLGAVLATTTWSASSSWTLAALPLFIWMGEILFRTKLSEEMFRGLSPWVQWLPGRLTHVNVIGCGIFAAVSGSSAATCATIGKIALPELDKRGYDKGLSLGSLAGSGTLGLLIPPSIPMVVYAVTANVSVLQVFLGGFLPGVLVMVLYSGYIIIWSLLNPKKIPPRDPPMSFRQKLRESARLAPCLLLILAVFLSLVLGFATATECAAWGVSGALLLAWWSRTLTRKNFLESIMSATRLTCHDHADPGRRCLHDRSDGLYGHSGGTRHLGPGPTAHAGHARAVSEHHVHHPGMPDRWHLDDRSDRRDRAADGQAGRPRPGLVRRLPHHSRRDGSDHAAGRF
ncbi:TRAP-type mannitol/chloroaromatic compound transport system permease large subunit [Bradyrhizobium sp. LB1.3]